jgi:D-alanyl-lipoteichoic acid acyltransferase DltB (MBOAT superfamily)
MQPPDLWAGLAFVALGAFLGGMMLLQARSTDFDPRHATRWMRVPMWLIAFSFIWIGLSVFLGVIYIIFRPKRAHTATVLHPAGGRG